MPESTPLKNSGLLKLNLMIQGLRVSEAVLKKNKIQHPYNLCPQTKGNLNLILKDGTHVSAPYQEEDTKISPYELIAVKKKNFIQFEDQKIEVKVLPTPAYYEHEIKPQVRLNQVAISYGNFVSLALGGHRYLQPHLVSPQFDQGYNPNTVLSVDEVIESLEKIHEENSLDVVSLSCWNPDPKDGGILQIEPYIRAIKKNFNLLLLVEVHLPQKNSIIDQTYAMGADSVCYHLGNLCQHGPVKDKVANKKTKDSLKQLEYAVSIFPPGTVLSHITIGDNDFKDLIEDIDQLTKIKILPILTFSTREAILENKLTTQELAPLFGYVYNAANQERITMNWLGRLAPFITPIEGRYFAGDTPRLKLALLNLYQSRLFGGSISAGLSDLRRKLRVKVVEK